MPQRVKDFPTDAYQNRRGNKPSWVSGYADGDVWKLKIGTDTPTADRGNVRQAIYQWARRNGYTSMIHMPADQEYVWLRLTRDDEA